MKDKEQQIRALIAASEEGGGPIADLRDLLRTTEARYLDGGARLASEMASLYRIRDQTTKEAGVPTWGLQGAVDALESFRKEVQIHCFHAGGFRFDLFSSDSLIVGCIKVPERSRVPTPT